MKLTIVFFFVMLLVASCKEKINSMQDVMNAMAPERQRSTIDPFVDNVIKGEKGTQVFIPANALRFKDGTVPTGKVNIELKEFFSISEFISNNLSTISDSFLLETNGMLYISATADGKEVVVDKDKSYSIAFPKTDTTKRMGLFYGQLTETGTVNWRRNGGPVFVNDSGGPAVEGMNIGYDSLLLDSTLYQTKIGICGETWVGDGDPPSTWRINHPDSNVREYIYRSFDPPVNLLQMLCDSGQYLEIMFYLNDNREIRKLRTKSPISPVLTSTIMNFFKRVSPFSISRQNYETYFEYRLALCCHHEFNQEKYAERFKQKYTQYKDKAIEKMDKGELGLYVFSATKFGWINCDRFYDDERDKIDFIVKAPSADSKTFIVFDSINSIMAGNLTNGNFIFSNVPVGAKVKVIGINFENGKPGMAVHQSIISKKTISISNFKSFTISELEKQLNKS